MTQAAPPSRTLDQVMCAIEDKLDRLIALVAGMQAGGLPLAYTLPGPSGHFRIWAAQVTTTPTKLLEKNPARINFAVQWPSSGTLYLGDSRGSVGTGQVAPVQATELALGNHVGEVWAASVSGTVSVTIVEQWV